MNPILNNLKAHSVASIEYFTSIPDQMKFSVSPNGEKICFFSNRFGSMALIEYSLVTNSLKSLTNKVPQRPFHSIYWSRDGQYIFYIITKAGYGSFEKEFKITWFTLQLNFFLKNL